MKTSKLQSIKYFNDCEPLVKSRFTNSTRILYEKIKLEFSILHANKGIYSLEAKLYDKQVLDYFSEKKKNYSKQKIVFEKFFTCDFYFEKQQKLQIILNKDNHPIEINTTLGSIIGSLQSTFTYNYSEDESLVIKAEKLGKDEDLLDIKFKLENGSDPNFFINNKFYYLITCRNTDIYKSAENNDEGTFEPIHIPICLLQPFYTVNLYNLHEKIVYSFRRTTQKIKMNEQYTGTISLFNNGYLTLVDNSKITKNFTFIDYIKSGVKIALSIGIDFTNSNGHPSLPRSLHSLRGVNNYEKAITTCGKIVGHYDYDQLFPVFGFGAKINGSYSNHASMCFNLNFSNDPNIHTIENVVKAYHDCIEKNKLTFWGPTCFTPLIKTIISRINKNDLFEYHILMILTDGVIDDLQQTIDILVEASVLPLSVIIIGIGNADFKGMKILDGDEVPLTSSKGRKRMRDLVQFVPFSQYKNDPDKLAMEVLAEIPRQIVEFYQFKNLNPKKIGQITKNGISTNNSSFPYSSSYYESAYNINYNHNPNNSNSTLNIHPSNNTNNEYYPNNQSSSGTNYLPNTINQYSSNNNYMLNEKKDSKIKKNNNKQKKSYKFIDNKDYFSIQNQPSENSINTSSIINNNVNIQNNNNNNSFTIENNNNNYQNGYITFGNNYNENNIQTSSNNNIQGSISNQPNPFYIPNNNNAGNQYYNHNINLSQSVTANNNNLNNNVLSYAEPIAFNNMSTMNFNNNISDFTFTGNNNTNEIDLNSLSLTETIFFESE